ncbi:MAG: hypothetical protein ACK56I_25620, partial [bacterium]
MAFPLGGNSEGAKAHEMEMTHMPCFNPTLHGVFQGQNCLFRNNFKLVLEDPFANGCEGARVHG